MPRDRRENWIGLLSFGFFIMLFALFFLIVPNYGETVVNFFKDIKVQEVSPGIFLPAPEPKPYHRVIYETAMQFSVVFGLFQVGLLAFRFYLKSYLGKVAETVSNIVFWLGATYMFYLKSGTLVWFPFVGGIIAVIGFSVIIRSLITLLFWRRSTEASEA